MDRATLKEILDSLDGVTRAARDGDRYQIAAALQATLFAEAGEDVLTVARVERVELRERHVAAATAKGERFYLAYPRVVAFKVEGGGQRGAGFV